MSRTSLYRKNRIHQFGIDRIWMAWMLSTISFSQACLKVSRQRIEDSDSGIGQIWAWMKMEPWLRVAIRKGYRRRKWFWTDVQGWALIHASSRRKISSVGEQVKNSALKPIAFGSHLRHGSRRGNYDGTLWVRLSALGKSSKVFEWK